MKLYHKAFLFRHKWIQPYLQKVLGGIDAVTFLAALALIGGVVYEHGFIISEGAEADLGVLYRTVWGVFLVQTTMHIGLAYRETLKKYRTFTWVLNILLYLTLIPVIFKQPYFSADSVVVTFLIALIFGGDRTLGKTDQSLPDSGRKFLPYYLYRHRFVDVTSLYR